MIEVDVWADVRCPWCWIGLRRLRRAAAVLGEPVRVQRRSFLLEPEGPVSPGQTTARVATSQWGLSPAQWASTSRRIRIAGRREGLDITVEDALMFDSRPVHRLLKLAAATSRIDTEAAWDSTFAAHFTRHERLGDLDVLRAVASGWGLTAEEIDSALAGGPFADEVAEDLSEAQRLSVESVPTVVAPDGRRTSGTAPVEDLAGFLASVGAVR